MGKIIRLGDTRPGARRGNREDFVRLRQTAGLDEEQHAAELREECGWRFPMSTYRAWVAGTTPPPSVLEAAERLVRNHRRGQRSASQVSRRDFLRSSSVLSLAGTAGGMTLSASRVLDTDSLERLMHAFHRPGRVDRECVQQLERTTIVLQRQEGESRPEALLGSVKGHLEEVMQLIEHGCLGTGMRERLWSIAGETAGIAGWLTWQSDQKETAAAWFEFGAQAAANANDRPLGAYLMGCLATQPHYREDPALRLQQLTGGSFGFDQVHGAPATRAWLATMEAEAHALLGRSHDALQALKRAEAIMSKEGDISKGGRPMVPSSHGAFFNRAYLAAEEGLVHLKLGDARGAISTLVPLLASVEPSRRKNWFWLYPMLATAYIEEGGVEEACRLATECLSGSMAMNVATNLPLISGVRHQLDAYGDHVSVRELDEMIRGARTADGW